MNRHPGFPSLVSCLSSLIKVPVSGPKHPDVQEFPGYKLNGLPPVISFQFFSYTISHGLLNIRLNMCPRRP